MFDGIILMKIKKLPFVFMYSKLIKFTLPTVKVETNLIQALI